MGQDYWLIPSSLCYLTCLDIGKFCACICVAGISFVTNADVYSDHSKQEMFVSESSKVAKEYSDCFETGIMEQVPVGPQPQKSQKLFMGNQLNLQRFCDRYLRRCSIL